MLTLTNIIISITIFSIILIIRVYHYINNKIKIKYLIDKNNQLENKLMEVNNILNEIPTSNLLIQNDAPNYNHLEIIGNYLFIGNKLNK